MILSELEKYRDKRIHFIAIGGCSMSGLAMILNSLGYNITGSDKTEGVFTKNLEKAGIKFSIGHDADNVLGAGLVIYNAAIKPGNPEYDSARDLNIPMMDRATLLGLLSKEYDRVTCVAGCHGKTTITSMAALILIEAHLSPVVHVGGMMDYLSGGVYLGDSDIFLTEACEYVGSFLKLSPKYIILNNIDDDHLDFFKSFENIFNAFRQFVGMLPKDGILIANIDDPHVKKIAENTDKKVYTYSLSGNSDIAAENIEYDEHGFSSFDFCAYGERQRIKLNILGEHNIQNAIAAIALCHFVFGVELEKCAGALKSYTLAGRRFEYLGEKNGYKIIHDYAHHPAEIYACLKGLSKSPHNKLWAVFQCNSYSRARSLKDKYATCFSYADHVIVPDIFPGRDKDTGDIYAPDLVEAISKHSDCAYIPTFEEIDEYLTKHARPGDIVVTIGSGTVYSLSSKLL